jgi:fermentation-respiration switch protein FrsA (DUF1100 family)
MKNNRKICLGAALLVLAGSACGGSMPAQIKANTRSDFLLLHEGQLIGHADYLFHSEKEGYRLVAHYSFPGRGGSVDCTREAAFGSKYELITDALILRAGETTQHASIDVDTAEQKMAYKASSGPQQFSNTFDLHPGTVLLNNFDPSGVQNLILMQGEQQIPNMNYWVVLEQGKGILAPAVLAEAPPTEGALKGESVALHHWVLTISGLQSEIWANTANELMEFDVPAQGLAYTRKGFSLSKKQPVSSPWPGAGAVTERKVSFRNQGLDFPAALTLPKHSSGRIPIVVLIPGSGPHDMDETLGPNKPFRDLAYGLAAKGIATLRYDKRSWLAPQSLQGEVDLDHEVTSDAVAALAYASTFPEVDPKQVFLLGHSLGGTMAPVIVADRLAERPESVRGIIFLAGAAQSVEQTLERQVASQDKRHGATDAQVEQKLEEWRRTFANVRNPDTQGDQMVGSPPLSLPVSYWRSWMKQDPAAELAKLNVPALVLRGSQDTQVSEKDFTMLQKAAVAPGSSTRELDGLDHMMMYVPADETNSEESLRPSHVGEAAIVSIAAWVMSLQD